MTRRSERTSRRVGRPNMGKTIIRNSIGCHTIWFLPRDIAAVRQSAAIHQMPGRQMFLDCISAAELKILLTPEEVKGNRIAVTFDALEGGSISFENFKRWSLYFNRGVQDCISSLIFQVFGEPPTKPAHVPEPLWAAWAYTPWSKDHPEIRWPMFYEPFRKKETDDDNL